MVETEKRKENPLSHPPNDLLFLFSIWVKYHLKCADTNSIKIIKLYLTKIYFSLL